MNDVMSPFPFFGGKAKLAPLLCDMLDYKHTDFFIDLYGGGGRILLNKPRHKKEIYNDASRGLSAFFELLSKQKTGMKLIERIYKTEYTEDCFEWALSVRAPYETSYLNELKRRFSAIIRHLSQENLSATSVAFVENILKTIRKNEELQRDQLDSFLSLVQKSDFYLNNSYRDSLDKWLSNFKDYNLMTQKYWEAYHKSMFELLDNQARLRAEEIKDIYKNRTHYVFNKEHLKNNEVNIPVSKSYYLAAKNGSRKKIRNFSYEDFINDVKRETKREANTRGFNATCIVNESISLNEEIELATATYVTQVLSRDGMGKCWSGSRFDSQDSYYSYVDKLYDVMERMQGVDVWNIDARTIGKYNFGKDIATGKADIYNNGFLDNERVMMCLDPSYLQDAIQALQRKESKNGKEVSRNAGKTYAMSYEQTDYEEFLKSIRDAKCRILLCGYDDINHTLENYLIKKNPSKSRKRWKHIEAETKTTVPNGTGNNDRTEMFWYNYDI